MPDYENTLYYTLWGQWDDLFNLMIRTQDDILSKKIELFLNAYHYSFDEQEIMNTHDFLIKYVDHAMTTDLVEMIRI